MSALLLLLILGQFINSSHTFTTTTTTTATTSSSLKSKKVPDPWIDPPHPNPNPNPHPASRLRRFLSSTTKSYTNAYHFPGSRKKNYISHNSLVFREATSLGGIPRMERYTAADWLHNIRTIPQSSILKQIAGPVLWCTLTGVVVSFLHRFSPARVAGAFTITKTPHTLLGSALGLLLVFRTNTAYARFWEGRKIWETVLCTARDLSRMTKLFEAEIGAEERVRCMCLLAAFPYLLRQRVQPTWLFNKMERDERRKKNEISVEYARAVDEADIEVVEDEKERGRDQSQRKNEQVIKKTSKIPWATLPKETIKQCR